MVKVASLVLSLIAVAPRGAAIAAPGDPPPAPAGAPAAPPAAAPPVAAPPVAAPPAAAPPVAPAPPASSFGPPSEAAPGAPGAAAALPPTEEEASPPGQKSPLAAFGLSFAMPIVLVTASATLLDVDDSDGAAVLVLLSATVGPSTGWFYAGRPLPGLLTAAARLGGGWLVLRSAFDESSEDGAAGIGVLLFVSATLVDWIGPAAVVASDNASARTALVPTVHTGGAGLSLVGSF